jgi:hypothetical protein
LLKTVASEMAKHNLDLVAVQEVRWVEVGSKPGDIFPWKWECCHICTGSFIHKGIISTVNTIRGRSCDIIILNEHSSIEDKSVV